MKGMSNNDRPFTQFDNNISPTQEDNGDNGAGDRPVPDNGTKNENFSAGGMREVPKCDYPLPPDPHNPTGPYNTGNEDHLQNFGQKSGSEIGFDGGIDQYGLVKGEVKQGSVDDSIAGQGFGNVGKD